MPTLSFDVEANYDEVVKLREQINKLQDTLQSFGPGTAESTIRSIEGKLASCRQQFAALAAEAAKSGADVDKAMRESINRLTDQDYKKAMRQATQQKLQIKFDADTREFDMKNAKVLQQIQQTQAQMVKYGKQVYGIFSRISSMMGFSVPTMGLWGMAKAALNTRMQMEQLQVSMEALMGGADKVKNIMEDLKVTAKNSPYTLMDFATAAKSLAAYGIEADKINDKLKMLGNISSGLSIPLGNVVRIYGMVNAQGAMMSRQYRMVMMQGIPITKALAKELGVAEDKIGGMISKGKVTAEVFDKAMTSMATGDGQFAGMLEKQADTIRGQITGISRNVSSMFNEIGTKAEPVISAILKGLSWMTDNWQTVGKVMGSVAAGFAAFKVTKWIDNKAFNYQVDQMRAKLAEYKRDKETVELDKNLQRRVKAGQLDKEEAIKIQKEKNLLRQAGLEDKTVDSVKKETDARIANVKAIEQEEAAIRKKLDAIAEMEQRQILDPDLQGRMDALDKNDPQYGTQKASIFMLQDARNAYTEQLAKANDVVKQYEDEQDEVVKRLSLHKTDLYKANADVAKRAEEVRYAQYDYDTLSRFGDDEKIETSRNSLIEAKEKEARAKLNAKIASQRVEDDEKQFELASANLRNARKYLNDMRSEVGMDTDEHAKVIDSDTSYLDANTKAHDRNTQSIDRNRQAVAESKKQRAAQNASNPDGDPSIPISEQQKQSTKPLSQTASSQESSEKVVSAEHAKAEAMQKTAQAAAQEREELRKASDEERKAYSQQLDALLQKRAAIDDAIAKNREKGRAALGDVENILNNRVTDEQINQETQKLLDMETALSNAQSSLRSSHASLQLYLDNNMSPESYQHILHDIERFTKEEEDMLKAIPEQSAKIETLKKQQEEYEPKENEAQQRLWDANIEEERLSKERNKVNTEIGKLKNPDSLDYTRQKRTAFSNIEKEMEKNADEEQKRIDKLNAEFDELEKKANLAETRISNLKGLKKGLLDKGKLDPEEDKKRAEELVKYEEEQSMLQKNIDDYRKKQQVLQFDASESTKVRDTYKQRAEIARRGKERMDERLSEYEENQDNRRDIHEQPDKSSQLRKEASQMQDKKNTLSQKADHISDKIDENQQKLDALEQQKEQLFAMEGVESDDDVDTGQLEILNDQIAETENRIESLKAEFSSTNQEILDTEQMRQQLEDAANAAEEEADKIRESLESAAEDAGESAEEIVPDAKAFEDAAAAIENEMNNMAEAASATDAAADANNSLAESENTASQAQTANTSTTQSETAAENAHSAATRGEATSTAGETGAEVANTTAKKKNTVTTLLNTAAHKAGNTVAKLGTQAWNALKMAINGVKASLMSSGIGLIIGGLTSLATALFSFGKKEEEASAEMETFGESAVKTKDKVNLLYNVIAATNKTSKVHKEALEELKKKVEEYGLKLDKEKNDYEQLIALHDKLTQSIMEEGKQRQIANRIASLNADKSSATDTFTDTITKNLNKNLIKYENNSQKEFDEAERKIYGRLIAEGINENANEILESIQRIEELKEKLKNTSSQDNKGWGKLYEQEIAEVEKFKKMLGGAVEAFEKNNPGAYFDINKNNFLDTIKKQALIMAQYDDAAKTLAEQERLANPEGMQKLWDKMTISANSTAKEWKDATMQLREFDKLKKEIDKTPTSVQNVELHIDTHRADEELTGWGTMNKKESIEIEVNKEQMENAKRVMEMTKNVLEQIDSSSTSINVDSSNAEQGRSRVESIKEQLNSIDDNSTKIRIDYKDIDIAIRKLEDVADILKALGGNIELSRNDKRILQDLGEYYYWDASKGKAFMKKQRNKEADPWVQRLYNDVFNRARQGYVVKAGGKIVSMGADLYSEREDMIMRYRLSHPEYGWKVGGNINYSKLSDDDKKLYDSWTYHTRMAQYRSGQIDAEKARKDSKKYWDDKIKPGLTTNEYDATRKDIQSLMADLPQNDPMYKQLEKTLETLNKNDKSKGGKKGKKDDPKERAYKLRKELEQERRRLEKQRFNSDMKSREFRIKKMEEGTAKEVATIHTDSIKRIEALKDSIDEEARRMEEHDRKTWLLQHKDKKDHDWEAQRTKSLADYKKEASIALGFNEEMYMIEYDRDKRIGDLRKQELLDMWDYLSEYGSIEQKRIALQKKYEEESKGKSIANRMKMQAELRESLRQLEKEQYEKSMPWDVIFSDLGSLTQSHLDEVRSAIKSRLESPNIDPADAKTLVEQLNNVEAAIISQDNQWLHTLGLVSQEYDNILLKRLKYQRLQEEITKLETRKDEQEQQVTSVRSQVADNLAAAGGPQLTADQVKLEEVAQLAFDALVNDDASRKIADELIRILNQSFGEEVNERELLFLDKIPLLDKLYEMAGKEKDPDKKNNMMQDIEELKKLFNQFTESTMFGFLGTNNSAINIAEEIAKTMKETFDREISPDELFSQNHSELFRDLRKEAGDDQEKLTEIDNLEAEFLELNDAIDNSPLKTLIDSLLILAQSEAELSETTEQLNNKTKEAGYAFDGLIKTLQSVLGEFGHYANIAATNLQSLSGLMEDVGLGGTKAGEGIAALAESARGISDAFSAATSGDIIGGVRGIVSAFTNFGKALGSFGVSFFGPSDRDLEKDVERLAASNEALDSSIQLLTEKLDRLSVTELAATYKEAADNIKKSMDNTQEMMRRSGKAYDRGVFGIGGRRSSNTKINNKMSDMDWAEVSRAAGVSVTSASQFWTLSSKQMRDVATHAAAQYGKIKQYASDGYADAAQYMDAYIDYCQQLEELQNQYREALTSVSFDSLKDQFRSTLMDMESSVEDFTGNFEEMMRQTVINALVNDIFDNQLQQWYEDFASAVESNGGLDMHEQEELKKRYEDMAREALHQREQLTAMMGWDDAQTQQSTSRSLSQMSQDTGDAIAGRMTAIQMAVEAIRGINAGAETSIAGISDSMLTLLKDSAEQRRYNDAMEMKFTKCFLDVSQIAENTGAIVKPIKDMQNDISEIHRKIKNI